MIMIKRTVTIAMALLLGAAISCSSSQRKKAEEKAIETAREVTVVDEPKPVEITGRYNIVGKTGDRVSYRGTLVVTKAGDENYTLKMIIGRAVYMGKGKRSGDNLTVTWKSGVWEYRIDNDTGVITGSRENRTETYRPQVPPGRAEPKQPAQPAEEAG